MKHSPRGQAKSLYTKDFLKIKYGRASKYAQVCWHTNGNDSMCGGSKSK